METVVGEAFGVGLEALVMAGKSSSRSSRLFETSYWLPTEEAAAAAAMEEEEVVVVVVVGVEIKMKM